MNIKANVFKLVLEGPFPCSIRMTVKDDSALNLACGLFEAGGIVTGLFGKELINNLFVKTELKHTNKKTESDKSD
jgi:hypothetical protein